MTATCNFVSLGDKMCELLVKKWKKEENDTREVELVQLVTVSS